MARVSDAPAAPLSSGDAGGAPLAAPLAAARPRSPAWVRDFGSTGAVAHAASISKLADGVSTGIVAHAESVSKLADGLFVIGGAIVLAAVINALRLPNPKSDK
jgi:hypothetical protein